MLAEQLVLALRVAGGERGERRVSGVADRDERVAAEIARVLTREVEALVPLTKLGVRRLEPGGERDDGLDRFGRRAVEPAPLDSPVPRTDVLADVTAVDLVAELLAI